VPIRTFLAGRAFASEAISAMSLAFGDACDALGLHPTAKDPATSLVAEKVIEFAIGGAHDVDTLRTMTLKEFTQNDLRPSFSGARSRHPVNRALLLRRLAMTERHIAAGERYVTRQREIVAELERHNRGKSETTKVAKELLQSFEMAQAGHLADRGHLKRDLGV
jgi:hypothetical protein